MSFKVEKDEALNKTIRMSKTLIAKLEKLAQEGNVSFNKVVVQCCEYAIQNLDQENQK